MSAEPGQPPSYLGIDLGGTNIKSGVVEDSGRILSSVSLRTDPEAGPEAGIEHLAEAGRRAVKEAGLEWGRIACVGLGSPGTMDLPAGLLLEPPNLHGWENLPIRQLLSDRLGKPVVFQNDGNAAAYGEYWIGAGRGVHSLVMFTLGTGIGGGIVIGGEILEGRHSHGAECGHVIVEMDGGRICSCGQPGHLEAYASATSMVKRAHEALTKDDSPSALRDVAPEDVTSRLIAESAAAGDALAGRLMSETARYLAVGAVSMMHTIDPDLILFGGGMTNAGDPLLEEIRRNVRKLAFPIPAAKTRIEFAKLGGDAGFVGAAGWARAIFSRSS
jgi:glucokinase